MSGAELLVGELKRRGISFIAVLCGHGLNPLLYAAQRAGIRIIDVHNEQTASYIADAYARLTRRVGICAVSAGVAHVNAFAGLLNAWFDCAPVVLITGASELRNLGRGAFQDVNQVHLAMPICKRAELVTCPERIPHAVHESFNVATAGYPGPVHLTIPLDVLSAEVDPNAIGMQSRIHSEVKQRTAADAQLVREAVRMLASASAPLIIAGTGAFYADAGDELLSFASLSRIPIVTPIWDRGVVDYPSQYFLG
ncbi:MAG TPA: thiamine pyrophosphate-binding protein, partial [Armatimonadetes bacterium]|nr:thiamine pyrophosphate-binding protein [Armatimonadota bacterium]